MKHLYSSFFITIAICCCVTVKSQTYITPKGLINPSFGLNGGDIYANQIATTTDGYTYAAGQFTNTIDFDLTADTFNISSTFFNNMFIAKYDKQSHLIYAFKLSGRSGNDNITAIATDDDDNVYVAGYFSNTVDFDPGPGTANLSTGSYYVYNLFFAKYDKNGNYIFAKPVVSPETRVPGSITTILADNNLNIFIAGSGKPQNLDFDPGPKVVHPQSHGKYDAFFAKYDSSGNYVFSKAVGSIDDDYCNGFAVNKNKDIIVTGSFANSSNDFDPNAGKILLQYRGESDGYVGIYDSLGNYKYAFPLGGVKNDAGYGIATDNDNNIIVSGSFYGTIDFAPDSSVVRKSSDSDYDYFIAKYTQNAKLLFVTTIHTDSQVYTPLVIDSVDNIYIGGGFIKSVSFDLSDTLISKKRYNAFIAKFNAAGVYDFSNQISGSGNVNALTLKSNNQICVAGFFSDTTYFNSNNTRKLITLNQNSFIAVYNASKGNNISANAFGTYRKFNVESGVVKLAHDDQNNTYVTGTFEGVVDFDPGIKQYILTSSQDASTRQLFSDITDDIFFAKYNTAGNLIFAKNVGGTKGQTPVSITIDTGKNIYLTGTFEGNIDADPGPDSAILYSRTDDNSINSFFIGKFDSSGNYIFAKPIYINGNLNALTIDKSNNIYIAGNFFYGYFNPDSDTSLTDVNGGYIFFAKYTNNGKFVYIKSIGEKNEYQACNDIAINSKGNILISGSIIGSNIDFDPGVGTHYANPGLGYAHFLAVYKSDGNFVFETNSVSLNSSSGSTATALKVDKSDNVWISGLLSGTVNFDANSDSLIETGTGNNTAYFIKYNSKGYPLFVKTISEIKDPVQNFLLESAAVDEEKNFYLSGYFYGKIDFDPGNDTAYLTADKSMHSSVNLFLAKYDSLGNYDYAYNFAPIDSFSDRSAYTKDLYINKNLEIIFAVNTNGNIDFNPGPDTLYYHRPFDVNSSQNISLSFVIVKFKQTQTVKPFTIYALSTKAVINKSSQFNLNRYSKYLK